MPAASAMAAVPTAAAVATEVGSLEAEGGAIAAFQTGEGLEQWVALTVVQQPAGEAGTVPSAADTVTERPNAVRVSGAAPVVLVRAAWGLAADRSAPAGPVVVLAEAAAVGEDNRGGQQLPIDGGTP